VSPSRRSIERILETTWRKVLQLDECDLDDNFFELGVTSFDAVAVITALNDELAADISEIGLFERPTIRAMTELLCAAGGAGPDQGILDSQRRGALRGAQRRASERVRRAPDARS
jgi:acyl carrier protein